MAGFQSTPPARGATLADPSLFAAADISIHAPREGGDRDIDNRRLNVVISIHAPREGGDNAEKMLKIVRNISIHAPREGGDSKDAQFYLWIFDK